VLLRDRRLSILADVLIPAPREDPQRIARTYTRRRAVFQQRVTNFGYLAAVLMVEPQAIGEVRRMVESSPAEISSGAISDDEFQRAISPWWRR